MPCKADTGSWHSRNVGWIHAVGRFVTTCCVSTLFLRRTYWTHITRSWETSSMKRSNPSSSQAPEVATSWLPALINAELHIVPRVQQGLTLLTPFYCQHHP